MNKTFKKFRQLFTQKHSNKSRPRSAFSLIEISIVILIIGVLITGVIQGGKLLQKFRLQTARSLTNSSVVSGITGLVAWYESTVAESFDSTVNEDSANRAITTWYDINPQTITKNNGTQSTAANKPLYAIESSSGLPMVYFDGSNDHIILPNSTIPYDDSSFTIFIATVPLHNSTFDKAFIMCENGLNVNNLMLRVRENNSFRAPMFSQNGNNYQVYGGRIASSKMNILTASYSNGYSNTASKSKVMKMYLNGKLGESVSISTARTTPTINNTIGARRDNGATGENMYGYIGEIIIYNRSLNDYDRKAVEKYLGQKWGVAVIQ